MNEACDKVVGFMPR